MPLGLFAFCLPDLRPQISRDSTTAAELLGPYGASLTAAAMRWYWAQYTLNPEIAGSPYVSPLRADEFAGPASAFVLTCELDPVRDDGELWAEPLRAAGVAVEHRRYPAMHIMLLMDGILDVARRARADLANALRRAFRAE